VANNIRVVLEIDNQQYIASINKAEQATKNFGQAAAAEATKAGNSFDSLNTKTSVLTTGMGKLRTILAGAAFVGFARSSLAMADAIDDLRAVSGLATDEIIRFRTALQQGGGSADDAGRAITSFFGKVDEAAQGSAGAQAAFARVGVTLNDLATLGEQELLAKTIAGLNKITDPVSRATASTDLLGKAFKGVLIDDKFLSTLQQGTAESENLSKQIERAADLNEKWEATWDNLRLSFIEAFGPILEGIATLLKQIPQLTTAFKALGVVLVGVFAATGLRTFVSLLGMAGRGVAALGSGFKKIRDTGVLKSFTGGAGNKGIASARDAASAVGLVGGVAAGAYGFMEAEEADANKESKKGSDEKISASRKVVDGLAKQKDEILNIGNAYRLANEQAVEKISRDAAMIGMTDDMKETYQALFKSLDDQDKVELELNKKRIEGNTQVNASIDEQIKQIRKNGEETRTQLAEEIALKQTRNLLDKDLIRIMEGRREIAEKIKSVQEDYELQNLTGTARKLRQIEVNEERILRNKLAQWDLDNAKLPEDQRIARRKQFATVEEQLAKESIERQQEIVSAGERSARSFESGWKRAFEEYVDNATNAALAAQRIFQKVTQGMEDLIVNFAKTGKFEFKSFMNSILEELLRSQVRQLMSQIFSLSSGANLKGPSSSGILGGSIIPGFLAQGGPATKGMPYMVGENGPELFVPEASGNVIPNNQLATSTYVTYNINAVDAMSFKQMVAADPSFIYAVTQQGAKSIPSNRR
jgi:hypothetical protein